MAVALAWLLQRSPNILLIPGTSSVAHLRENVAGAGLTLSERGPGRAERDCRLSTALPGLPARVIESKDPITRFRAMNRFRSAPQASPSTAHEPMKLWSKCLMITRGRIEQPHGKTAHGKILCRANGIINVAICRVGLLVPEPIDGHGQELRCFVEVMSDMGCRGAVDTQPAPAERLGNQSRMLSGALRRSRTTLKLFSTASA